MTTLAVAARASGAPAVEAVTMRRAAKIAISSDRIFLRRRPLGAVVDCRQSVVPPLCRNATRGAGRRWDWGPSTAAGAARGGRGTLGPQGDREDAIGPCRVANHPSGDRVPAVVTAVRFSACLRSGGRPGGPTEYARRHRWRSEGRMAPCPDRPMPDRDIVPRTAATGRPRADRGDDVTNGSGVALATQGLNKPYGSRVALDGLDLRVPTVSCTGSWAPTVPARPRRCGS